MITLIADRDERLDRFLARSLPDHSRAKLARLIEEGEVRVEGHARKPSFPLREGMRVELVEPVEAPPHDLTPAAIELRVVYEDEALLVVDKPRGLATHPAPSLKEPSLVNALLARSHELSQAGGSFRPGIVHRLDKETTGLLVVAKRDAAHVALARQIAERTAERRYVAWLTGRVPHPRLTINAPIERDPRARVKMAVTATGKPAVTHLKRLAEGTGQSLVAVRLETGRTHQIRVHARHAGHPVVGDKLYGGPPVSALQLHAAYLALDHPETGERMAWSTPPPDDFADATLVPMAEVEVW